MYYERPGEIEIPQVRWDGMCIAGAGVVMEVGVVKVVFYCSSSIVL